MIGKLVHPLMLSLALIIPVAAETVVVPIGQQATEKQRIDRPRQGMSKTYVQQNFGEPQGWRDAVGDPPISSWTYENFTVYFEYDTVIHSVLNQQPTL